MKKIILGLISISCISFIVSADQVIVQPAQPAVVTTPSVVTTTTTPTPVVIERQGDSDVYVPVLPTGTTTLEPTSGYYYVQQYTTPGVDDVYTDEYCYTSQNLPSYYSNASINALGEIQLSVPGEANPVQVTCYSTLPPSD